MRGKFLEISAKSNLYLSSLSKSGGYPDSRHIFYKELPNDISSLEKNINMLCDVISLAKISEEESNKLVSNINIYTADISQELLLKFKVSDREAHKILSEAITSSESKNKDLDLDSLNNILNSKGLDPLTLEEFNELTNPKYILSRRKEIGSASPEGLTKDIDEINKSIKSSCKKIFDKKNDLSSLFSEVNKFLST